MTSLVEIKETLNQLSEKVDKLSETIDQIINKNFITIDQLEAIAAKIINETQTELQKCFIEINKTTTVLDPKTEETQPLFGKYSYPNYNVGNEELGSSRNPSSMSWPKDYFKST